MPNWKIRQAKPNDEAALIQCIDRAYACYAGRFNGLPAVSDGIAEDIVNNIVWVATLDNKIVGGLILIQEEDHLVLANVAVDPNTHRKGLGRILIELAEAEAVRLHKHEIQLTTHVGMPENVLLYGHLGWQKTEQIGSKIHMSKAIKL